MERRPSRTRPRQHTRRAPVRCADRESGHLPRLGALCRARGIDGAVAGQGLARSHGPGVRGGGKACPQAARTTLQCSSCSARGRTDPANGPEGDRCRYSRSACRAHPRSNTVHNPCGSSMGAKVRGRCSAACLRAGHRAFALGDGSRPDSKVRRARLRSLFHRHEQRSAKALVQHEELRQSREAETLALERRMIALAPIMSDAHQAGTRQRVPVAAVSAAEPASLLRVAPGLFGLGGGLVDGPLR